MINEHNHVKNLISEIEISKFRTITKKVKADAFKLWANPSLESNLSGNNGVFFIRAILNQLDVDEHRIFKWRLENKYRQYQIVQHYAPGHMASTISFSDLFEEFDSRTRIKDLCNQGYFIKSTSGDSSGRTNSFDRTGELDTIVSSYQVSDDNLEKWILQERLNFSEEFRIHSFNNNIIYGLTFIMEGFDSTKRAAAEGFVEKLLCLLPEGILIGSLIGWDIGITEDGDFYVIELNFTGFHPEFQRGFQTSGYFGDPKFGSVMCAWFNNHCKYKYHVYINSVDDNLLSGNQFYQDFIIYSTIFNDKYIDVLKKNKTGVLSCAVIYFGKDIDRHLIILLEYFHTQFFFKKYYLIVDEKNQTKLEEILCNSRFTKENLITIVNRQTLFTPSQYDFVQNLSQERRKLISCYYTVRAFEEENYFIV